MKNSHETPKRKIVNRATATALGMLMPIITTAGLAENANAARSGSAVTDTELAMGAKTPGEKYFASEKRNRVIEREVTELSKRFIKAGQPGGALYGHMKSYNPNTDKWGLTGNQGWVYRQVNDLDYVIVATVWQDKDGSVDLGRGVQGFSIGKVNDESVPVAEFESPSSAHLTLGKANNGKNFPINPGWTTTWDKISIPNAKGVHSTINFDQSPKQIGQIDTRTLFIANLLADRAGI